jgi:hypothetical protein
LQAQSQTSCSSHCIASSEAVSSCCMLRYQPSEVSMCTAICQRHVARTWKRFKRSWLHCRHQVKHVSVPHGYNLPSVRSPCAQCVCNGTYSSYSTMEPIATVALLPITQPIKLYALTTVQSVAVTAHCLQTLKRKKSCYGIL